MVLADYYDYDSPPKLAKEILQYIPCSSHYFSKT